MIAQPNILFEATPKQTEFADAVFSGEYRILMYGGAIRGGKTFIGLALLLVLCRIFPRSRWAVVRKDMPTMKRNTIPSFKKLYPSEFLVYKNEQLQLYRFENGSEIIFFPENYQQDPELERWKGLEVNGFLLEEVNELQSKTFYKAIERAGTNIIQSLPGEGKPPQPPSLILCTCNPSQGWVKESFYTPWKEGRLPSDWFYLPAKITDNPHIPEEFKESLKSLPHYQYQVFVEGNWDVAVKEGGEFYGEFELDENISDVEYNPHLPIWLSFDENVRPYLACTIWQIQGYTAYLIDEIALKSPRNNLKETCKEFIKRYPNHEAGVFVCGDATSRKEDVKLEKGHNLFSLIIGYLKQYSPVLRVPKSNPSVVMRGNFINECFRTCSPVEIIIGKHCTDSINDLTNTKQAPDGTKEKKLVKENGFSFQKWGHLSDTMDYVICEAFKSQFAVFKTGGFGIDIFSGNYTKSTR